MDETCALLLLLMLQRGAISSRNILFRWVLFIFFLLPLIYQGWCVRDIGSNNKWLDILN
jgi:hypothetical protein